MLSVLNELRVIKQKERNALRNFYTLADKEENKNYHRKEENLLKITDLLI